MTFDEILDQAIELLRRRGRITYRALKRQFDIDDDYFADLKAELIEGQRVARDESGTVLVWTGGAREGEAPAGGVAATRGEAGEAVSPASGPRPAAAGKRRADDPRGTAERRQLTVMFSDIVGSTELSAQLDPEDLRDVVRAYQRACSSVVESFDGRVVQHLGDGILVYFGYPQAHEDDASRAVRAGLAFFDEIEALNESLAEREIEIHVRVGIHTGLVVVGEMGGEGRSEVLALGETPNIAARIQHLTGPDSLVITGATRRLLHDHYELEPLGPQDVRGIAAPVDVYRVVGETSVADSMLELDTANTPFVGRHAEAALLMERWEQVAEGRGQMVLVSGEAGIGKSRLVRLVRDQIAASGSPVRDIRCSSFYHNSALRPVIELLLHELEIDSETPADERFSRVAGFVERDSSAQFAGALGIVASLLSVPTPDGFEEPPSSPDRRKALTFQFLEDWILGEEGEPALILWEDLHWADPSTLELADRIVGQIAARPVLALGTYRPEFRPAFDRGSNVHRVVVNRLTRRQVEEMVYVLSRAHPLPDSVVQQIVAKTDGNPLFVEEVTKLVMDAEYTSSDTLPGALTIPATLHDSLMARLDRIGDAKETAQLGATIGREFSQELLEAVSPDVADALAERLGSLVQSELVLRRGSITRATYTFKHALVQEVAYRSLLKSRRQEFHQRIARVLDEQFPQLVELQPELMAHHLTSAGMSAEAVPHWLRAGERAVGRSAHAEALGYLRKALRLLGELPEGPDRARQELMAQIALGVPLTALRGYGSPDVEEAYRRARELCAIAGDESTLVPALYGLWRYYLLRAQYGEATELVTQIMELARSGDDDEHLAVAHRAAGSTVFYLGRLDEALEHFQPVLAADVSSERRADTLLYDVVDAWVTVRSYAGWTLRLLGRTGRALELSDEAIRVANDLGHPFSMALSHAFASWLHQFCGDAEATLHHAEEGGRIAEEHGFAFWVGWSRVLAGWARAEAGDVDALAEMEEGLAAWHATGSRLGRSYFLQLTAEVQASRGLVERALISLRDAELFCEETGERFWLPEIHRLQGELVAKADPPDPERGTGLLRRAVAEARAIGARMLEVRALTGLVRLEAAGSTGSGGGAGSAGTGEDGVREELRAALEAAPDGDDQPDLAEARRVLAGEPG